MIALLPCQALRMKAACFTSPVNASMSASPAGSSTLGACRSRAHLTAHGCGYVRALLPSVLQRRSMQPRHEQRHGCGGRPLRDVPHVGVGHWVGLRLQRSPCRHHHSLCQPVLVSQSQVHMIWEAQVFPDIRQPSRDLLCNRSKLFAGSTQRLNRPCFLHEGTSASARRDTSVLSANSFVDAGLKRRCHANALYAGFET